MPSINIDLNPPYFIYHALAEIRGITLLNRGLYQNRENEVFRKLKNGGLKVSTGRRAVKCVSLEDGNSQTKAA